MQLLCGLCLITLVVDPVSAIENDYYFRDESSSKDLGIDKTDFLGNAEQSYYSEGIDAPREKKSLRFHRPSFLGGANAEKISPSTQDADSPELPNSLLDEAATDAAENIGYPLSINPETNSFAERAEKPRSRVQESLSNVINSLHKRETRTPKKTSAAQLDSLQTGTYDAADLENQEALSDDDALEDSEDLDTREAAALEGHHRVKLVPPEGPRRESKKEILLDSKIRDLTDQINAISDPRSKVFRDKSDLELLHEIIDQAAKVYSGGKKIRSLEKGAFHETSQDADERPTKRKLAKDSSNKDDSSLDSDLERMIQDAAERIGLWVNQNFDNAKKMGKSKPKSDPAKKEHAKATGDETSSKEFKQLSADNVSARRKFLDAEAKRAALKILIHAATAKPQSDTASDSDDLDEPSPHKKGSSKLSVGEVKKIRTTTLPPCMTTKGSECNTRGKTTTSHKTTTAKSTTIDPKVLEELCAKTPTRGPKTTCRPCTTEAIRKSHPPSGHPKKGSSTTEPCDVVDKLLKLLNATWSQGGNGSKVDSTNLADLFHMLVTTAEFVSNSTEHISSKQLDDKPARPTECASPTVELTKFKDLSPDHALKNANNRLLSHFVNLATLEATKRRSSTAVDKEDKELKLLNKEPASQPVEKETTVQEKQPADSSVSPLKALTVLLDLMRVQPGDADSNEPLRLQSLGENGTIALNVFIKAAIVPEFKNVSIRHSRARSVERPTGHPRTPPRNVDLAPTIASPRSRYNDNGLNNLLKSIIVKARFERRIEPQPRR